jgi:predicted XRE-type DNA-binding protein
MQTEMKKIFYLIFIGRPGISVIQSATINDFRELALIIMVQASYML